MINLNDVTFLIPFRYDSEERLRNLRAGVAYLNHNLDCNIIITEESPERKFYDTGKFTYHYVYNPSPIMHRTKLLNDMAKQSRTNIIVLQDTDVILPTNQLFDAAQLIRKNIATMVFPYGGKFVNFIEPFISKIISTNSINGISENQGHVLHPNSVGGSIFFNKSQFIAGGMENEYFRSWGYDDTEMANRFTKLGYTVARIPGILYHLHHPSSTNSANTSHQTYYDNVNEFNKVQSMNKDQLLQYVASWPWTK